MTPLENPPFISDRSETVGAEGKLTVGQFSLGDDHRVTPLTIEPGRADSLVGPEKPTYPL